MEVLSENLVEKIVNVKQKLQEIQNYIISNDLPIDIKLEHSNLDNFNFADKKYLLHSLTSYNCMWQIRKLNIPPQEYFDYNFNFIENISNVENSFYIKT